MPKEPQDKKDWYALGKEAEDEEHKGGPASKGAQRKALTTSRQEWYEAAGEEVPHEKPKGPPLKGKAKRAAGPEMLDPNSEGDLIQVSAGRTDPPWGKIGTGLTALLVLGLAAFLATRKPPPEPREIDLPIKNVQNNRMYGFVVDPPEGFRQRIEAEPEFLKGIHGDTHQMIYFTQPTVGVNAYYFGELRKDMTLDKYVEIGTDVTGKASAKPLDVVPDGMKDFPTKGFLIDAGDKVMLYYASQDKDIFVSVYAVAPKDSFDKQSEVVQAAVRALKVTKPTGPHPDKQFSPTSSP